MVAKHNFAAIHFEFLSMNNKQWLEHYIQCLQVVSADKAVAVYSFDFKFLYTSELYLKLSGATTEIIGKSFRDSSAPGVELADQLQEISTFVNETGKKARFIIIYPSPLDQIARCFRFETYRVYNPHNGEPVCQVGEVQILDLHAIVQLFNLTDAILLNNRQEIEGSNLTTHNLSIREQEILFLLLMGKSYKEIAGILTKIYKKSYSASSASSLTMRQLIPKFQAYSVKDMLSKAINAGAIKNIPPSLLSIKSGIHLLEYI